MTGFGRGSAEFGEGRIVLEIRSVNHRYLELRSRSPRELLLAESHVEQLLKKRLHRGFCTVNLFCEGAVAGGARLDRAALHSHLRSLAEVGKAADISLAELIPVLANAPDLFVAPAVSEEDALQKSVEAAFEEAIGRLIEMRRAEGAAMAEELEERLDALGRNAEQLAGLAAKWPPIALNRIRHRLAQLMEGSETALAEGRVEAEAAMLVERTDISEETTRLKSHLKQLGALLGSKEPIGRRMEFLLQEIGREINTIGAKTALPEISDRVIEIKADLEKMRELAQNVE